MNIILVFMCGMLALAMLFMYARSHSVPISKMATGYIVIWLLITVVYVWFRMGQSDSSFMDELPVFASLFGIPSLCAVMIVFQSRAR